MTFEEFNAADAPLARDALLRCCGSEQWAQRISDRRPFIDREMLFSEAESVWWALEQSDWLEAFSAHPRIGEKKLADWCSEEQSGAHCASAQVFDALAQANEDYERRFGWIFLVNASGKTAPEMLSLLQARLANKSAEELRVAAREQVKITRSRLSRLLGL